MMNNLVIILISANVVLQKDMLVGQNKKHPKSFQLEWS